MVTAWRVLAGIESLTRNKSAGLILDWQQRNERLIASGNVSTIRLWDLNKELPMLDIATNSESAVTSISSNKSEGGNLIFTGFTDGIVKLFDSRIPKQAVSTFNELRGNPIVNVKTTDFSSEIVTGSTNGIVKIWDPRNASSTKTIETSSSSSSIMQALAIHSKSPLIATGSQDQRIKVMNYNGDELSLIKYHDGFLGQRIGSISCLSFHPYHLLLSAGATDSLVSIYAAETFKTEK